MFTEKRTKNFYVKKVGLDRINLIEHISILVKEKNSHYEIRIWSIITSMKLIYHYFLSFLFRWLAISPINNFLLCLYDGNIQEVWKETSFGKGPWYHDNETLKPGSTIFIVNLFLSQHLTSFFIFNHKQTSSHEKNVVSNLNVILYLVIWYFYLDNNQITVFVYKLHMNLKIMSKLIQD